MYRIKNSWFDSEDTDGNMVYLFDKWKLDTKIIKRSAITKESAMLCWFSFFSNFTFVRVNEPITIIAWKVPVFRVILARIFPHLDWMLSRIQSECGKIRTRITPHTDTFHVVIVIGSLILTNVKLKKNLKTNKASSIRL